MRALGIIVDLAIWIFSIWSIVIAFIAIFPESLHWQFFGLILSIAIGTRIMKNSIMALRQRDSMEAQKGTKA